MQDALGIVLFPLLLPMETLFKFYAKTAGSHGWAVVLLGATMAVLSEPLRRAGQKTEFRLAAKTAAIKKQTSELDKNLAGEERFWALDKIYKQNKFHPAHNMLAGASFVYQLPFLIAAFLMLSGGALPEHSAFGFIKDLSRPDGLLGEGFNVLPPLVFALSMAEYCFAKNRAAQKKLILIPAVICILIYNLPSGLVLYWAALSVFAAVISFCRKTRRIKL